MKARTPKLTSPSQPPQQLSRLLHSQRKRLNCALLLAVTASLLFILQCYLLASLFAGWLIASQQGLPVNTAQLLNTLPWLALCLLGRPVLQYYREHLSLAASQHIRSSLRVQLLAKLADAGPAKNQYGNDGSLSSKLVEQVDALDGFISRYLRLCQLILQGSIGCSYLIYKYLDYFSSVLTR